MANYTPGPWYYDGLKIFVRRGNNGDSVDQLIAIVEDSEANAALIASAPDLLHLVKSARLLSSPEAAAWEIMAAKIVAEAEGK